MDHVDRRGDESTVVPIDHVDVCEFITSPATISGGEQVAADTAPGTVSTCGEGLTAVDDSGREESKENCSGEGACELVAVPAAIFGSEEKDKATEAVIDEGESCVMSAQAVIPRGREARSAVDDGGNESKSSENCDENAATAMISGRGGAAATLDGGGGGKSCENFHALDKDMSVRVEGYGQVAVPVIISGGLEVAAAVDDGGIGGKKRGRPRRGQVRAVATKKVKVEEEEEDVCFICFDGGNLVLCDRRGCPKAYHPACLKHDEAFFQSKAKWTCDWHVCSICQKAAHHMCYTCTFSLCKTCTKGAGYLSLRDNRGLCAACMRTIMLIERDIPGDKDTVQVDFDDKNSWEYFFKYYWVSLKEKLSLSLDELIQAKSPHKVAEVVPKEQPLDAVCASADCNSSISNVPSRNLKATDAKNKRVKEQYKDCQIGKLSCNKRTTLSESPEWATEELLEFVAHMRSGDVSMLSQFDVQALLLEYIKRNNLRDPRQKSQIICDSRLVNLFGKPRVAHFEMLKLLEYHFLMDKDNQKESAIGNIVCNVPNQVEGGGNNESLLMIDKDKKRKARRKGEEREPQKNLDEFAAIDVHNINLIYLRRSLMENLVTANAKFHDKVVGSIVRIRISGADPKQDMYRLVQVIGTCKASVPYQVGGKTVDVMLVILNLHKKETVAIDSISNQEFSEDECRRLRQSIKCGLVKQITVGLVQEKAKALQEVRLNDWLETEMVRLNHLRDRASEKGLKKELRECVEKIELLKTPEERERRLNEKLQVHVDPKMDPKCESDDDAGEVNKQEQADQVKQRLPSFRKLGRDPISLPNRSKQAKFDLDKGPSSRFKEKVHESPERKEMVVSKAPIVSLLPERKDPVVSETPTVPFSNGSETEMCWHYRDPNGKIQGPFCLLQLRKWSTTGYFPQDMRVWGINTGENYSFRLTDVLNGDFLKPLPSRSNTSVPDRLYICEDRHSSSVNPTLVNGGKQSNGNLSSVGNKLSVNIVSNNPSSNFSLASVAKSADSSGPHQIKNAQNMGRQAPVIELPSPTPKLSDKDDKADSGSQNHKCAAPMEVDMDEKVNSSFVRTTEEIAQATEIKPPVTCCCSEPNSPTPSVRNQKADMSEQNLQNPSRNTVDGVSIHNSSSSAPNQSDIDEKFGPHESKPPLTSLTCDSATSERSDRDEKAGVSIQNLPNLPSKTVDLSIQNSSSLLPNPSDRDQKFGSHEIKPPLRSLTCDSVTSKQSDRDEKSDASIHNLCSLSSKTVDEDGNIDSRVKNLPTSTQEPRDGNDKVCVNESKPPGTILTFISTNTEPDVKNEVVEDIENLSGPSPKTIHADEKVGLSPPDTRDDEKTGIDFQNLPSSSPKTVDENDKVLANEIKPPSTSLTCDFTAPETYGRDEEAKNEKVDLIPSMKDKNEKEDYSSTITSNWGTFLYEPIELCALAEESVSDLWAEVDAMEAQGDVAPPTSGDDFFEDSISGIDHLFDFGKTDDTNFNGESSSLPQATMVSEPLNSSIRSNGINDYVSFERRSVMGSDWGNTNLGFGVLTQEMSNVNWGSHSSVVQLNMDVNRNTSFGFMGDERRRVWRGDGSMSHPEGL